MASDKSGSLRTKSTGTPPPRTRTDDGLIALRYEDSIPAKPPIPVTVAPPRAPPTDTHPAFRRPIDGLEDREESKRDSGLAPTTSSKAREGSVNTVDDNVLGLSINFNSTPPTSSANTSKSIPQTPTQGRGTPKVVKSESVGSGSMSKWRKPMSRKGSVPRTPTGKTSTSEEDFSPITTPIPTESLLEEDFLETLSFSKRGSVMLGGKKAINGQARLNARRRSGFVEAREIDFY